MIYVQFGTENDRFSRKINPTVTGDGFEYTIIINTPQVKQFDYFKYTTDVPLALTHDFLATALMDLATRKAMDKELNIEYENTSYHFILEA